MLYIISYEFFLFTLNTDACALFFNLNIDSSESVICFLKSFTLRDASALVRGD